MIKLVFLLIIFIFVNNCSFNENSQIWNDKENKVEKKTNIKKVFQDEIKIVKEFNQNLQLNMTAIKTNNKFSENHNNFGSQNYTGELKKNGIYKFSKLKIENEINFKPIFLQDGIIFFDKNGTISRYNDNFKIKWKQNYYSKAEKKINPKLNFIIHNENLIIADSIAKYYSINIKTGDLNWIKSNIYPFNSDIKKYKDKIFVVDYKNILRCYKIKNGSECWNLQTEDTFTISNSKYSLVVIEDKVIFSNSIGDITAVDIETGLITWQLPTQSSSIVNETYNFKISKLVIDENAIYFSNNKNQFYSVDIETGTINWINGVNTSITPVVVDDLIFTVSKKGFLYVLEKKTGNIIRITDLFKNYKQKKRKNIFPIGFSIGNKNLYLTNSDGKLMVVDLIFGNVINLEKISAGFISKPYIFNNSLYIVRNGSIIQFN